MNYIPAPPAPTRHPPTPARRRPEQPDEARKTAQPGQFDPQSKQIADLSDGTFKQ